MVYRPISTDLKETALYLWGEGWVADDVMELLGVSQSSMYRWRANKEEFGSVDAPTNPLRGRPRVLDAEQTDDLLAFIDNAGAVYLQEILDWLAVAKDIKMARSTLQALINDAGYTYKKLRRQAAQQNPAAIAEFVAFRSHHLLARMCVCVDESSKDNRTIYRHYGYAPSGHRAVIQADAARGTRYSILPAMSVDGYIAVRIVEGSVDGQEFADFIINEVMVPFPSLDDPNGRCVLIMDNCNIHKSDALKQAIKDAGVLLLYIPPYSPAFNPIEESFSALKAWIRHNYIQFEHSIDPIVDLLEACASITKDKAAAFFAHAGYD